jgi:hypothetical protein
MSKFSPEGTFSETSGLHSETLLLLRLHCSCLHIMRAFLRASACLHDISLLIGRGFVWSSVLTHTHDPQAKQQSHEMACLIPACTTNGIALSYKANLGSTRERPRPLRVLILNMRSISKWTCLLRVVIVLGFNKWNGCPPPLTSSIVVFF